MKRFIGLIAGLMVIGASASAQYIEGPWFAEQVARGDLPPIEERLPAEPLVLAPGAGYAFPEGGRHTEGSYDRSSTDMPNIQGLTSQRRSQSPVRGQAAAVGLEGLGRLGRPHDLDVLPARGHEVVRR